MSPLLSLELVLCALRVLLGAACVAVCVWGVRHGPWSSGVPESRVRDALAAGLASMPQEAIRGDYAVIARRDLFRGAALARPVAQSAPPSTLPLRLIGTVALDAPELSMAVVEDPADHKTRVLRVGATIGDASVVEIQRKSMLVSRAGRLERISLVDSPPRSRPGRPPARSHVGRRERLAAALQRASAREKARALQQKVASAPGAPDAQPGDGDDGEDGEEP